MTVAAANPLQSNENSPLKARNPTARVRSLGVLRVKMSGIKNSFQELMKVKMIVVAIIGLARGRTNQNCCTKLAPSTMAASYMS